MLENVFIMKDIFNVCKTYDLNVGIEKARVNGFTLLVGKWCTVDIPTLPGNLCLGRNGNRNGGAGITQ